MNIEIIASLLNNVRADLDHDAAPVPDRASLDDEYVRLEEVAINGAIELVREFPGFERHVWSAVTQSFQEMNAELIALGYPELEFVDYRTFLAIVEVAAR